MNATPDIGIVVTSIATAVSAGAGAAAVAYVVRGAARRRAIERDATAAVAAIHEVQRAAEEFARTDLAQRGSRAVGEAELLVPPRAPLRVLYETAAGMWTGPDNEGTDAHERARAAVAQLEDARRVLDDLPANAVAVAIERSERGAPSFDEVCAVLDAHEAHVREFGRATHPSL
ncbi:MAG TPA: hypothetical protein VFQ85_04860 [Mycobacteriales bacterium]|nr:hypothetical protein [Mycobacteriales bacterium]